MIGRSVIGRGGKRGIKRRAGGEDQTGSARQAWTGLGGEQTFETKVAIAEWKP